MDSFWTYVRTDKNGTKHYVSNKCPRCGGTGWIRGFEHVEGGRCFKCGGFGISSKPQYRCEYTPEYAEKMAQKKLAKDLATANERNRQQMLKDGFSEDGEIWIVLGKSFDIKDDLKAAGARFDQLFGWHFNHAVVEFPCMTMKYNDVTTVATNGTRFLDTDLIYDEIDAQQKAYARSLELQKYGGHASEHVGQIGDRVVLDLTYLGCSYYETHLTFRGETHWVYKFVDEAGNKFVWNTTSYGPDFQEGQTYHLRATIKEHGEYKDEKQTSLARVKIEAAA